MARQRVTNCGAIAKGENVTGTLKNPEESLRILENPNIFSDFYIYTYISFLLLVYTHVYGALVSKKYIYIHLQSLRKVKWKKAKQGRGIEPPPLADCTDNTGVRATGCRQPKSQTCFFFSFLFLPFNFFLLTCYRKRIGHDYNLLLFDVSFFFFL